MKLCLLALLHELELICDNVAERLFKDFGLPVGEFCVNLNQEKAKRADLEVIHGAWELRLGELQDL